MKPARTVRAATTRDAFASKLADAMAALCQRHDDLSAEQPALIAVSGGMDSIALLHGLAGQGWQKLIVCHLDHGLRGRASTADAALVRRTAKQLGLKSEIARKDVAALAKRGGISIELAGRRARDDFFQRMARRHRTRFVLLAHHLDDQAETILGNLFRGTGLAGLGGMAASAETAGGLIKLRPLLEVRRAEINAHVTAHKLQYREDASNTSAAHRRNRLRHEVLPLLCEVFGRDVSPILARVGQSAARDHALLDELARVYADGHRLFHADGSLRICEKLETAHPALQSRILRRLLVVESACEGITSREIEAAARMLAPGGAAKTNLPGGKFLRRKAGRLWVEKPPARRRIRG